MFSIERTLLIILCHNKIPTLNTGVSVRLQVIDSESSAALPLYCIGSIVPERQGGVMRGGVIAGVVISNNNPC